METLARHQTEVLYFIVRVILGILFFFQGHDKLFNVKISGVIDFFKKELGEKKIPGIFVNLSAWYTSCIEFVCGGLLILGMFKTLALYLLGIDLILVAGAFSIMKPVWDMQFVFPRLILLTALLYLPSEWDTFSLDFLMKKF
jgi:uncharacterized membrane protein YphA (DoxX/SURF4 family)